jgi:hypothetical protein
VPTSGPASERGPIALAIEMAERNRTANEGKIAIRWGAEAVPALAPSGQTARPVGNGRRLAAGRGEPEGAPADRNGTGAAGSLANPFQ